MSTTAPPAPPWARWRPERPVLPAPTPDEVAAVRARTEARRTRTSRSRRANAAVTIGIVLVLVAFVGLFALDLATDGAVDGSHWAVLLVAVAQCLVYARRVRRCLRVDDAVRNRLAAEGTEVSPAVGPAPSRPDRVLVTLAVAALVVAVAGLVAVAVRHGGADAWARTAVVGAVTGLGLRQAWQLGTAAPVGTSAVLRAVDGALRRQDLTVALVPAWFVVVFSTTSLTREENGVLALLPVLALAAAAFVGIAALVRDDGWVLRDHRIATATPPAVWLAEV